MATRASKRQAANSAMRKIRHWLEDEERPESNDGAARGVVKRKNPPVNVVEYKPAAAAVAVQKPTGAAKKKAKGPEVVKVKRHGVVHHQKKERQNENATKVAPFAQAARNHYHYHYHHYHHHDNGNDSNNYDAGVSSSGMMREPTESELKQFRQEQEREEHEIHLLRRAEREKQVIKTRLSRRTRHRIRRRSVALTPVYSPIDPECLHFHFTPNPGSPENLAVAFQLESSDDDDEEENWCCI